MERQDTSPISGSFSRNFGKNRRRVLQVSREGLLGSRRIKQGMDNFHWGSLRKTLDVTLSVLMKNAKNGIHLGLKLKSIRIKGYDA